MVFVYLMENQKALNEDIVKAHVAHLRRLDLEGKLILCGPFADYPGGMVVIKVDNIDEGKQIAESDPFISSGCKTYDLHTLEVANAENDYLL